MAEIDDLLARVAKLEEFAHAERWRATAAMLLVRALASELVQLGRMDRQALAAMYASALNDAECGNATMQGAAAVIGNLRDGEFWGPGYTLQGGLTSKDE